MAQAYNDAAHRLEAVLRRSEAREPQQAICHICGKPATCIGEYETRTGNEQYACDTCCVHGNEDGHCRPITALILEAREPRPAATELLTFAHFSAVNRQRCESPNGFNHQLDSWSTSDWFLAAVGELGEAANIAKKLNRCRDGIPGNREPEDVLRDKLRRELGDVYVYLDLLAQSLGIDIGAAAVEVFNAKSKEIGCPIVISTASGRETAPQETEK